MMESTSAAVAFIDMSGFTALTEIHGDEEAADLVDRFATLTRTVLAPPDRLVKTIGDAVMVTSPTAESGIGLITRILQGCNQTDRFPAVRVGAHVGSIVHRHSDIFGSTVNLAARIAAAAAGGQILATRPLADAARAAGIGVLDLGPMSFRNVSAPVSVFDLDGGITSIGAGVDPVCHMHLRSSTAAGRLRHRGVEYQFCSLTCVAAFAENPERFTTTAGR